MSYLTRVQHIDTARATGTRFPRPIRGEVNLGGDVPVAAGHRKKAGFLRRIRAMLVNILLSPAGDQGGWEGGARGL